MREVIALLALHVSELEKSYLNMRETPTPELKGFVQGPETNW